jgi:hypothetical protein
LNIHEVNDFRKTETHKAELLVPESRAFELEIAIEKYKITRHLLNSSRTVQRSK